MGLAETVTKTLIVKLYISYFVSKHQFDFLAFALLTNQNISFQSLFNLVHDVSTFLRHHFVDRDPVIPAE